MIKLIKIFLSWIAVLFQFSFCAPAPEYVGPVMESRISDDRLQSEMGNLNSELLKSDDFEEIR